MSSDGGVWERSSSDTNAPKLPDTILPKNEQTTSQELPISSREPSQKTDGGSHHPEQPTAPTKSGCSCTGASTESFPLLGLLLICLWVMGIGHRSKNQRMSAQNNPS